MDGHKQRGSGAREGLEIGRALESARKERGLSLKEAEGATKIRAAYLAELELENFDVLPAVYVLGSLKTYADFLGLDGAALSRQLKASLVEPAETGAPDQPGVLGDEEDEYEAAPVPAVGFDQLFLGMGVILVSCSTCRRESPRLLRALSRLRPIPGSTRGSVFSPLITIQACRVSRPQANLRPPAR